MCCSPQCRLEGGGAGMTGSPLKTTASIALRCLDLTSLNDADDEAAVDAAVRARTGPLWPCGRGVCLAALRGRRTPAVAGVDPRGGGGQLPGRRQRHRRRAARRAADRRGRRAGGRRGAALARAAARRRGCGAAAAAGRAPGLCRTDAEGDPRDRRAARCGADRAGLAAGARCRRRLPQDQHRQDADRRHAGRGRGDAARHRRPSRGA